MINDVMLPSLLRYTFFKDIVTNAPLHETQVNSMVLSSNRYVAIYFNIPLQLCIW